MRHVQYGLRLSQLVRAGVLMMIHKDPDFGMDTALTLV